MRFLLPVDSRLTNAQGFITLHENNSNLFDAVISEEQYAYSRKGFRGACVVDDRLYVCNSFSLKIYCITCGRNEDDAPHFELLRQCLLPEYLIGRGTNADLHFPYFDKESGHILVANSYMDCIDTFSLEGDFLGRKFLWEISSFIDSLAQNRNPNAADLCHVNFIQRVGDDLLLTLCNLNGSGEGAVMSYRSGEIILDKLGRPHDGVLFGKEYFLTETSKNQVLYFDDIIRPEDLKSNQPKVIDLSYSSNDIGDSIFWLRGLHVTEDRLYVGCSQFQDRNTHAVGVVPTHIAVVDKCTLSVVDRITVPNIDGLNMPVIYSLLDFDRIVIKGKPDDSSCA